MHSRFYAYSVIDVDNTGGIIGQSFTLTVTDIDGRTNTAEVTLEASLTLGLPQKASVVTAYDVRVRSGGVGPSSDGVREVSEEPFARVERVSDLSDLEYVFGDLAAGRTYLVDVRAVIDSEIVVNAVSEWAECWYGR